MFRNLLARDFGPYAALSTKQLDLLEAHYTLLLRWNAKLNLTRIESIHEAVRFHYCESLFVGQRLPAGSLRIADIGSGAGFPGIPIAILRPECKITLVESHHRKGVFLGEIARNLANVNVVTDRAENLEGKFEWLVSRAVSPANVLKLNTASNLAILLGGNEASAFENRELLPWGQNRYLVFHVKQPVIRF